MVGCAIVGRPVCRNVDWHRVVEVLRLATDGTANACSLLYAACRRIAREMGFSRIMTYTLENEPGTSLRAAGWRFDGLTAGGSWDCPGRRREQKAPTCRKQRWVSDLD